MKSSRLFILPALVALAGCATSTPAVGPEYPDLDIAAPAGAPAVAFYKQIQNPRMEINAVPKNVLGYLSAGSGKEIVVAPTHGGIKAIANGAPYKIAATLTFGNFYLAATGNDDDDVLDEDDYVVAFQQNDVPGKVFSYSYPELTNVHFLAGDKAAQDAAACLITGKNSGDENASVDYVFLAEPAMSAALGKNANASEYESVQEAFARASENKLLTQASVFVANDGDKAKVDAFLSGLKGDVESFLANPSAIDEYVGALAATEFKSKFNVENADTLKNLTSNGNRMGLGYQKAIDIKDDIENFVKLFGVASVDEEVFYR